MIALCRWSQSARHQLTALIFDKKPRVSITGVHTSVSYDAQYEYEQLISRTSSKETFPLKADKGILRQVSGPSHTYQIQ